MSKTYTPHPEIHQGLQRLSNATRNAHVELCNLREAMLGVERDLKNADDDLQELAGAMRDSDDVAPGEFQRAYELTAHIARWAKYARAVQALAESACEELTGDLAAIQRHAEDAHTIIGTRAPAGSCAEPEELINE